MTFQAILSKFWITQLLPMVIQNCVPKTLCAQEQTEEENCCVEGACGKSWHFVLALLYFPLTGFEEITHMLLVWKGEITFL